MKFTSEAAVKSGEMALEWEVDEKAFYFLPCLR